MLSNIESMKKELAILNRLSGDLVTFDGNPQNFEGRDPLEGRVILFKFPLEKRLEIGTMIENLKPCGNFAELVRS